ncbi:MAG: thermonuclease family protein [Thermoleophilia bacterium]|nr:thermonuclease family protein [Thermoleophilia bacterium]
MTLAGCGGSGYNSDSPQPDQGSANSGQAKAGKTEAKARAAARARARYRARQKAHVKRARKRKAKKVNRLAARPTGDVDCGAFSNQAQAQRRLTRGDPYGLDGDGDGLACTSLPCPCSKAKPKKGSGPVPAGLPGVKAFRAEVESVTDGDTLDLITASGREVTIRLIGIDTPEVYGGVECGGRAASAAMTLIATGSVTVRTDPTQDRIDRYGRLLAYVNKGDLDLGRAMVAHGYASAYIYADVFLRYPAYHRSEQAAKSTDRGSWDHCDLSPG